MRIYFDQGTRDGVELEVRESLLEHTTVLIPHAHFFAFICLWLNDLPEEHAIMRAVLLEILKDKEECIQI